MCHQGFHQLQMKLLFQTFFAVCIVVVISGLFWQRFLRHWLKKRQKFHELARERERWKENLCHCTFYRHWHWLFFLFAVNSLLYKNEHYVMLFSGSNFRFAKKKIMSMISLSEIKSQEKFALQIRALDVRDTR